MAGKKTEGIRTSLSWCKLAGDAIKASGIEKSSKNIDGLKGPQLWRAAGGKDSLQPPPLATAGTLYAAIKKRRPDINLPPPIILIESADQYEWAQLGTQLMRADPQRFSYQLERLRKIVAGVEAEVEAEPLFGAGGGDDRSV